MKRRNPFLILVLLLTCSFGIQGCNGTTSSSGQAKNGSITSPLVSPQITSFKYDVQPLVFEWVVPESQDVSYELQLCNANLTNCLALMAIECTSDDRCASSSHPLANIQINTVDASSKRLRVEHHWASFDPTLRIARIRAYSSNVSGAWVSPNCSDYSNPPRSFWTCSLFQ